MPLNACERGLRHVLTFAFFLEMPQSRWISFSTVLHFPWFEIVEMPHFPILEISRFLNIENICVRFWSISKKNAIVVT